MRGRLSVVAGMWWLAAAGTTASADTGAAATAAATRGLPAHADSAATAATVPSPLEDIDASHGIPLVPKLSLYVHPQPPPPAAFTEDDERRLLAGMPQPDVGGDDDFHPEAPESSIELAMSPHVWVHPKTPRAVAKLKIDDAVMLQSLIDSNGRVVRVRMLRGIPNCPECNKNARIAAEKFVYNAPPRLPNVREIWTMPFEFRFTAGKTHRGPR